METAAGDFRVAIWGTYEERDRLYVGSSRTDDPFSESVEISRALLELEYAIDNDLSVSAIFSWIDIDRRVPGAGVRETISGIGDTVLLLRWTVLRDNVDEEVGEGAWLRDNPLWSIRLEAGLTLPTGKTRGPSFNPGGAPLSLLQAGSGTVQPIFGFGVRADWGGLAATLDVRGRFPFYENDNDFQEGVSFVTSLGAECVPTEGLTIRMAVDADYRKRDIQSGSRIDPGGGFQLSAHPALVWAPDESIQVFAGVILPFFRDVPVRTLTAPATFEFGASFVF